MKTTLAGVAVGKNEPVRLMGVINASPESFFKGSVRTDARAIKEAAKRIEGDGADFIDIGAMSSAPYLTTKIPEQQEARRAAAAVEAAAAVVKIPISIDAFRAWPAIEALKAGARIVNDITGLAGDPNMGAVMKNAQGAILMAHPMSLPKKYGSPAGATLQILLQSINRARHAGVSPNHIVVDPGIGFFRETGMPWWQWDLAVLKGIARLGKLGAPVLAGVSRKSFIGEILKIKDPDDRLAGSLAATAAAVLNGAAIIRTHDVRETREAVRLAERLKS